MYGLWAMELTGPVSPNQRSGRGPTRTGRLNQRKREGYIGFVFEFEKIKRILSRAPSSLFLVEYLRYRWLPRRSELRALSRNEELLSRLKIEVKTKPSFEVSIAAGH
ncbi:hypothetical protein H6P81_009208 [Aristolochia fimbriata]|uniref:Uncharacterized protein n=1 Tax=Aristolochia fimbriata TaxID=158543 RepID=A0AAV7EK84_ARIFI|nr:hypothetical protein H6P81_009208 [Aristolochia fimbriata]